MKEIEAFAKALSLGMKALAKMIETAADQLEEQLRAKPGTEAQPSAGQGEKTAKRARGKQAAPGKSAPESAPGADAGGSAPKAKRPARKKPPEKKNQAGKPSDTETVYQQIRSAGEPIHLDEIHRLTGFEKRKLHNILHRLKRSERIRIVEKAVYAAN